MSYLAYGLDFGTTHSAISVLDGEGRATVLPVSGDNGLIIKSVLLFAQNSPRPYVGQEAIRQYLAAGMRGRLIQSIKSALVDENFIGTTINGTRYQIEDLIALIISFLKVKADKIIGQNLDRVVLGRPAIFSDNPKKESLARDRLIMAAQKAGFKEIHFQLEPIAAALHYETSLKRPEKALIADLGGGTSDFTLMNLSPDRVNLTDRDADVLQTSGVYVGGDNLDARIMWGKVVKHFGAEASYRS
ncbi:MAG: Hsp70 family protein, partial [Candidatus Komeilibacteria bacterium]|nr:Hsp70 family protein [Candidatus Komeilibacteria bacterium]